MDKISENAARLAGPILAAPQKGARKIVALAGPPAAGKSTLADTLAGHLSELGTPAQVVPMDGFHLDNRLLDELGLRERKGAPQTFDVTGFGRLLDGIAANSPTYFPVFDRGRDIAIAGAAKLHDDTQIVVVEGNYLLYDAPHWRDLVVHWDVSIWLDVPLPDLKERLVARWVSYGMTPKAALSKAQANDLANAREVQQNLLPATFKIDNQ